MYSESDYLTHEILNDFEERIEDLYEHYDLPYTITKNWQQDEFVYVDDIKNIEDKIDDVAFSLAYPTGYEAKRDWILTGEEHISFRDLNRWLRNIDFLINTEFNPLVPNETLKPALVCSTTIVASPNRKVRSVLPTNNIR